MGGDFAQQALCVLDATALDPSQLPEEQAGVVSTRGVRPLTGNGRCVRQSKCPDFSWDLAELHGILPEIVLNFSETPQIC